MYGSQAAMVGPATSKQPILHGHFPCLRTSCPSSDQSQFLRLEKEPAGCWPKAEPMSNAGCASVIKFFERVKILCAAAAGRGVRKCERSSPADTKVSAEGGQEVLQTPEQKFPCSPWRSPCGADGCGLKEAAAIGEEPTRDQDFWRELQPIWRS